MKWEEVIKNPDYQKLSTEEKKQWRKEYFDDIIKPKIKAEEYSSMWSDFSADADKMEGVKPESDKGFMDDVLEATKYKALSALTGAGKSYIGQKATQLVKAAGLETPYFDDPYEPQTTAEKIISGAAGVVSDLPIYQAGGAIAGAGTAGAAGIGKLANVAAQGAGAFGLHAGLTKAHELGKAGEYEGDKNIVESFYETLPSTGKGAAVGAITGLAGLPAQGIKNTLVKEAVSLPLEAGALLGAESVINDKPITKESTLEALGTIGILKAFHVLPSSQNSIKAAEMKGIPQEKVAEAMKSESVEILKDPQAFQEAVDKAIVKTEQQIEAEKASAMQDKIIDEQIKANYKEGKAPEQIIQINQIPKEYRNVLLEQTETGGWKYKPEVLEKINDIVSGKDPLVSQQYEEVLNPFFTRMKEQDIQKGQELAAKQEQLKTDMASAKNDLKVWENQKRLVHEGVIKDEIAKLTSDYRRYEHQPVIRDKMDKVIDYAMSVLTPDNKFTVANDPTTLMDHINFKESGYSDLKKPYQDAVTKEIVAKIIQETGFTPQHVINSAIKKADYFTEKEGKPFYDKAKGIASELNSIPKTPEYEAYQKALKESLKTDEQKAHDLREPLESIEAQAKAEKEAHKVNWQKAMGESESFKDFNRSNEQYFGKDHNNDMMEFAVKSPEEIGKTFEKANYMEKEFKQKGASIDLFKNKSRVIANKLGQAVYKNFVVPIRQAEHNFVVESQKYKDWIRHNKKEFNSKEREEMGEYLISLQGTGAETLFKMGIKPKSWEELTLKQQEAVTEMRQMLDVMFERINAARVEAGLDPLAKVDDYFTFLRKFSLMEELGYDPLRIGKEEFESSEISDFKTRGFAFQFGKERVESTRKLETDAYYVLDKYLTSALRTAHMTPVVGKLRTGLDASDKFILTNPNAHKYLHDTLDYVSGKKLSEAAAWINAIANKVNHNIGTFILTYNLRSMGVQPSAIVNTIGKLGAWPTAKGLSDFMHPSMQKFAMEKSKVLKARMHDITIEEMTKGLTGKLGKVKAATANFGTLPLRYLDLKTAQVTWLSGFRYGKEILKLTDKESVNFADDTVINSQGSASRIDLAPIQHTPLGKSLTLFNTFVINNLNFLASDIGGLPKTNKLVAEGITKEQLPLHTTGNKFERFTSQTKDGKYQYNIYERNKLHSTREGMEKLMAYCVAGFVCNTLYELTGTKSPLPSPISAAYEGFTGQTWVDALQGKEKDKKGEQLGGALKESMKEFLSQVPVTGGSFRYGGDSAFGAVSGLIGETFDTLAEKPGSKPMVYIVGKWSGIPGGQQVYKILKQMTREEKQEQKMMRRAADPVGYMKREMKKENPYYQQKKEMMKQMRGY